MLIFDQLRKSDPQLRLLMLVILSGMVVLLAGLWWVQIVSASDYKAHLEAQSLRTIRIPAVRGRILDRNGAVLAENRPYYNISLYLDELQDSFKQEYARIKPRKVVASSGPFWKRWFASGRPAPRKLTPAEKEVLRAQDELLQMQARYNVASNLAWSVSQKLQVPFDLDFAQFTNHYSQRKALPCPVARNVTISQIARFEEQFANPVGIDLEVQSMRWYPQGATAAHLLGHLRYSPDSIEGEDAFFYYRLPDYCGVLGVEANAERALHGLAGTKSVIINHLGYRQNENIWSPAQPGSNVVLTLDLAIQQAAEKALATNAGTRGAAVVMNVESGDILAMASSPAYDPNWFLPRLSEANDQKLKDSSLPEYNRATQSLYQAGSTFKTIVALALLETPEARFNPAAFFTVTADPERSGKSCIYINGQKFGDTVTPGQYDLRRALVKSSNSYFIAHGIRRSVFERVVEIGHRLHLGEPIRLRLNQETAGAFPSLETTRRWTDGERANICIGQGALAVTPLQLTVMACALANGGKVLRPRFVDRLESQDPLEADGRIAFPAGEIRDTLGVSQRSLDILRQDMLAETEDPEGTGHAARVPEMRVCGKTGTAERMEKGRTRNTTWFLSFAPYEHPKYAVVVAVEDGASGGGTCAPIAGKIYAAIVQTEKHSPPSSALARNN